MLTTIILTHNESSSIKSAIQSVSFCDQVIIIDDFSTDNTPKVASSLGARVYKRYLSDDFAAQRNFALSKAKNPWVLFIDPDELVSTDLKKEILSSISPNSARPRLKVKGFYIKRQDLFLGRTLKHGETANIKLLRLAKKNAGKWVRPVHETWQIKGSTATLNHPLTHRPHPTISSFLNSINHYTCIEARYRSQQGNSFSFLELIFFPPAKFIHNYYLRLGFLDGFPGLIMAFVMSLHSLILRIKLYNVKGPSLHVNP